MNKNNPAFSQKHSALIKAIIVSSSMLSLNAYTSTVSTEKVEPIPVTGILSNPLASSLYDVAKSSLPEPYKSGMAVTKGLFDWLLPGTDLTQKKLDDILSKLDFIESQMTELGILSLDTLKEVQELSDKINEQFYRDHIVEMKAALSATRNKYKTFYKLTAYPRDVDDFYQYAANSCKDGCTFDEQNIIGHLFGGNGRFSAMAQNGSSCNSSDPVNVIFNCYIDTINNNDDNWKSLNSQYSEVLSKKNLTKNEDKMVYYYSATRPIVDIQISYMDSLYAMSDMLNMQLAFFYAKPTFFDPSKTNFPFPLSAKKGQQGYLETIGVMTDYFTELSSDLEHIFGRDGNVENKETKTQDTSLVQYVSGFDYINAVTTGINAETDLLSDSLLTDCWFPQLVMNTEESGNFVGSLTAQCTGSETKDQLYSTSLDIPYKVDKLRMIDSNGFGVDQLKIVGKQLVSSSINDIEAWADTDNDKEKGSIGTWMWVAHSAFTAKYHVMFGGYSIELDDKIQVLEGSIFDIDYSKNRNHSRTVKGTLKAANKTLSMEIDCPKKGSKKFGTGNADKILYNCQETDNFNTIKKTDAWSEFYPMMTDNGHYFFLRNFFTGQKVTNSHSDANKNNQKVLLECLEGKGDAQNFCEVSEGYDMLTWSDGTKVELKIKDKQKTCPNNENTTGGGSSFYCQHSVMSVTTTLPNNK
jgi:hypothetical protein